MLELKEKFENQVYSMPTHIRLISAVIVSIVLTFFASLYVKTLVADNADNQFKNDSEQIKINLNESLNRYYDLVVGLHSFVLSNGEFTQKQFDKYVESLSIESKYPAIHGLNFVKYDTSLNEESLLNDNGNIIIKYTNPLNPRFLDENLYKNNEIKKEIEKDKQLKAVISKSNQYPFITIKLGTLKDPLILGDEDNKYYASVGAIIRLDSALFSNINSNTDYIDFQIFSPEDEGKGLIYDSRFSRKDGRISWNKDIFNNDKNLFSVERKFSLGGKSFFIRTFSTEMPPNVSNVWIMILFSIVSFIFVFVLIYLEIFKKIDRKKMSDKNNERVIKLEKQVVTDELTDMANRRAFMSDLEKKINQNEKKESNFYLFFIDLDGFKRVNDTLGHAAGDLVLIEYSNRLIEFVKENECSCYRLGGDEFTIILESKKTPLSIEMVTEFAGRLLALTNAPFYVKEEPFTLSQSVGIAGYPDDGKTVDILFKNSDMAMYEAKNEGKNNYVFVSKKISEEIEKKTQMLNLLINALEKKEFYIEFQPKMKKEDGKYKISCVEALLRWKNHKLGMIPPDIFIKIAEEAGLMPSIGLWLVNEIGKTLQSWKYTPLENLHVAINVSAKQFNNEKLADQYNAILAQYDISPKNLIIEITETTMMKDASRTNEILMKLKSYGFKISVDDFGTGHSSLSYLRQFPVDEIKIDKSFTDEILIDEHNKIIIEGIISMSQKLDLDVVVEGVETLEQVEWLEKQSISKNGIKIQGYYFSKPLNINELKEFYEINK